MRSSHSCTVLQSIFTFSSGMPSNSMFHSALLLQDLGGDEGTQSNWCLECCNPKFAGILTNRQLRQNSDQGSALNGCASMQDAVGNRVTLRLQDGTSWRFSLPFTPVSPLPGLALDCLAAALPERTWHSLLSCHLTTPGQTKWQLPAECGRGTLNL